MSNEPPAQANVCALETGSLVGKGLMEVSDPTVETYDDLNRAYRLFNQRLFNSQLKPCLITLRARGRSMGSFLPLRYEHEDGRRSHEIALNPETFGCLGIEQCLSNLAHEMVHQAQFETGTAGRRGYHNSDFARRMAAIGLPTSTTAKPGGQASGEQVSQHVVEGGLFASAARELVDSNFRAGWTRRFVSEVVEEWVEDENVQNAAHGSGRKRSGQDMSKVKFVCSSCEQAAWGKMSLHVVCGRCSERMSAA